jgi:Reverse transcriptase (RNA-dependent DNA polymerase)
MRGQENGGLPYRMGKALMVMGVLFKASRLNLFPTKASTTGFGAFVEWEGTRVNATRDLHWGFGDYAEMKTIGNSAKHASRTEAGILGIPTMNRAGSVIAYKLSTGTMVTRHQFVIRPIPDNVIQELNNLADEDNLPPSPEYIGENSWNFQFEDDDAPAAAPVVLPPPPPELVEAGVNNAVRAVGDIGLGPNEAIHDMAAGFELPEVDHGAPQQANEAPQQVQGVGDGAPPQIQQVPAAHPPQQLQLPAPARRGRHGSGGDSLRFIQGRALMSAVEMADRAAIRKELLQRRHWHDKEYCFKISVRAALRDRGDSAKAAIMDELENIVDKGVFHGVHMRDLTSAQRKTILRSVTFLKDKYTAQNIFEKFKARMCVDGSRQDHSMYEDVSSPTATCASVLSCAAIAAAEHRHVMTVDVKGAFLHADMKATGVIVHVQLDKVMTQFLVELDPTYAEFVRDDGTCVVQLDKALYGTIEAAKLWYDNISAHLISDGFVRNPYDPCVFNRINANGIQTTVVLYVDDMMVTCEDSLELDRFGACLRARYGKDQITEHRGTVLDFLGMTFDFTVLGKVKVTMKHLVDEIIAGCGVVQERKTPATEDLFEVRDTVAKLSPVDRDYFRSYTAKLLYIGKRVKPEMLTAISFLTTRATAPDTDDLAKLQRALGYLLYTRDRGIVLCIGDTMTVGGFIDAAYGVHTSSGKSHSGCAMVLGNAGPVHVKSTKQKLVTKSSTEAELVALSDYASQAIWLRNFILAQGYDVGPVVLHQDNMSCMALIKRGGPASERSRHIDIRYFWVKEKVDGKDAVVRHLPTDKMFVNVMTKPVQGQQFIRERNALTNWY